MSKLTLGGVLSIEGIQTGDANNILAETQKLFSHEPNMQGKIIYEEKIVDDPDVDESSTRSELPVCNVWERLQHTIKCIEALGDTKVTKEETNATRTTELIVDGKSFGKYHMGSLLALKSLFEKYKATVEMAKVLPATVEWIPDEVNPHLKSRPPYVVKKTRKVIQNQIVAPATDKHPAQVKEVSITQVVANITTTQLHTGLTNNEKHQILLRISKILEAINVAKDYLNSGVIDTPIKCVNKFSEYIFDFDPK